MKDLINIAMGELSIAFENDVMKAVQNVGIHVNKDELLQALELNKRLVKCEECKHESNCERQVLLSSMFNMIEDVADLEYCSYGERRDSD